MRYFISAFRKIINSEKAYQLYRYLHLNSTMVTACSGCLNIIAGILFYMRFFHIAGICLLLGIILDGMDGAVARGTGKASKLGGFWDAVIADALCYGVIFYMLVFISFLTQNYPTYYVILIFVSASQYHYYTFLYAYTGVLSVLAPVEARTSSKTPPKSVWENFAIIGADLFSKCIHLHGDVYCAGFVISNGNNVAVSN